MVILAFFLVTGGLAYLSLDILSSSEPFSVYVYAKGATRCGPCGPLSVEYLSCDVLRASCIVFRLLIDLNSCLSAFLRVVFAGFLRPLVDLN